MTVLLFKPRFAPLVEQGIKRQTIRPRRRRPPVPGDALSLRAWTGLPYRSKQRTLLDPQTCREVLPVALHPDRIVLGNQVFAWDSAEAVSLATKDGFSGPEDFRAFFAETHGGFPFFGILIRW
ncbi:MAG: ASCH domain-containing protein [Verrucomicrobiae bacterium]|nr:ASCH domain-containing protein [Verrucomicrobiae bacterium]